MHPGRLSLRTKLLVFNVGMVFVTLAVLVGMDQAFDRVRINGPLYRAIDGGQAVVADILPPPLFIVESHLTVFELIDAQAHGDTTRLGLLEARLRERESEFEIRHLEWARRLPPGTVRSALVDASYAPAATYFQVVDRELLPALHRNDIVTARELLAHTLQPLFAEHRDRIEFTVAAARRENADREANAASFVERVRIVVLVGWLVLAFAAFVIVRRGLIKPIVERVGQINGVLERIGAGDTRTPVAAHGNDEFAQVLRAIDRMRQRLLAAVETARGHRQGFDAARAAELARDAAPAALRGRRVLLVEDNELNRVVATELLCNVAGMDVTLAGNGLEALDRLREARFDLVLMDIQMPGMDGLQATRLIRADPALAHVPVIAATAHAFERDREQIRAAGMNDHVGKPFEPAQLFEAMMRWLAPLPSAGVSPAAVALRASDGPSLDVELGLRRCLDRPDLYRKILGRYLKQRAAAGNEIRTALGAGELEAAARAAHTLASTAAMLGAPALADVARDLHDAIDAGAPARWPPLLARMDELQAEVDRSVAEYLGSAA